MNQAQFFDGMLHPLWLLGLTVCWRARASPRIAALGMMIAVYAMFALSAAVRARYWLLGMTLLIPLLALVLMRVRSRWGKAGVMVSFIPGIVASGIYLAALSPWTYWLHGRDAFLQTHVPDYAMMRWADVHLPETAQIYLLWTGGRAYYLHRDYHANIMLGKRDIHKMIVQETFPSQSYLLMNRKLADRSFEEYMKISLQEKLECSTFLGQQGVFQLWKMNACIRDKGDH